MANAERGDASKVHHLDDPSRRGSGGLRAETEMVDYKVGPSKLKKRSGVVTGARIMLLFTLGKVRLASSAQVARELEMEEGYIRRVLSSLVTAGILRARMVTQTGTPGVRVFRLAQLDEAKGKALRRINKTNHKIDK